MLSYKINGGGGNNNGGNTGGGSATSISIPGLGVLDLTTFRLTIENNSINTEVEQIFINMIKSVVVPAGTTALVDNYLRWCANATSVILPSGLLTVGIRAFADMTSLQEITFPNSVTAIGNNAMQNNLLLKKVTFPASGVTLGTYILDNCQELEEIVWPTTLTAVPDYSFQKTTNLPSLTLPATTKTIGINAFAYSGIASTNLETLSALTTVGNYAFLSTFNLQNITFPASLTSVGTGVLYTSGVQGVDMSACIFITTLPLLFFANTDNLTTVILPPNLATFTAAASGTGSFYRAGPIAQLTLPASVVTIGAYTFQEARIIRVDMSSCTGLTTGLGATSFYGMPNLIEIILPPNGTIIPTNFIRSSPLIRFIRIPASYATISGANNAGAFASLSSLECIVFENENVTIQTYVFQGNTGKTIKYYAPSDMSAKLTAANVAPSVTWVYGGNLDQFASDYPNGYPLV